MECYKVVGGAIEVDFNDGLSNGQPKMLVSYDYGMKLINHAKDTVIILI